MTLTGSMSKTLKCSGPQLRFLCHVPIIALSLDSATRVVERVRVIVATLELIALTVRVYHHVRPMVFASTASATVPEAIPAPLAVLLCARTIAPITVNAYLLESVSVAVNTAERIVQSLFSIA